MTRTTPAGTTGYDPAIEWTRTEQVAIADAGEWEIEES